MISLKDITIKYGDFTAVKDVNIEIEAGEFFTFLGPSGCGKTTTLRAIAGFEQPSQGEITAFGKNLSGLLPEERDIGFVFQNYALFPSMNVYENIAFGLRAHKVAKREIDLRVRTVAEKTHITDHLEKKISELSGGQQQRIAIARALVLEPKILLMDEPLSNLDAKLRESTREEIHKLQRSFGITTIYVTHDQEEAMAISDRVAVFNMGHLDQIGTPKEIYDSPATATVARFIGNINHLKGETEKRLRSNDSAYKNKNLFVRPEKVKIQSSSDLKEGYLNLTTTVDTFEFLGAFTKITVKTGDGHLIHALTFGSNVEYETGDSVTACIHPSDILALEEESHESQ